MSNFIEGFIEWKVKDTASKLNDCDCEEKIVCTLGDEETGDDKKATDFDLLLSIARDDFRYNVRETSLEINGKHYKLCCVEDEDEMPEYPTSIPYRLDEWFGFAHAVDDHIQSYTIPQYGDYPNDQLTTTSNECIIHDMKRYLNRFNKGQRGHKEAMRDMLKIAQYAGVLYNRLHKLPDKDYATAKCK